MTNKPRAKRLIETLYNVSGRASRYSDKPVHYPVSYVKHLGNEKWEKLHVNHEFKSDDPRFKGESPTTPERTTHLVVTSPLHKELKKKGYSLLSYGQHDRKNTYYTMPATNVDHDSVKTSSNQMTKEQVERIDEAKRIISVHGSGKHTAKVYRDPEWEEYQVHHFENGKHMGEGPVSYHDDKEDAQSTAEHSLKLRIEKDKTSDRVNEAFPKVYGAVRSVAKERQASDLKKQKEALKTQAKSKGKKEFQFQGSMQRVDEVLSSSDPVSKWIDDFVGSDNPKFDGKTKEERRKMALGAYYAKLKEDVDLEENVYSQQMAAKFRNKTFGSHDVNLAVPGATQGSRDRLNRLKVHRSYQQSITALRKKGVMAGTPPTGKRRRRVVKRRNKNKKAGVGLDQSSKVGTRANPYT